MKTNIKRDRIHERRNKVYFTIKFRGGKRFISFDDVVKEINLGIRKNIFSRNETAHHIAVLTRKGKVGSKDRKGTEFFHHLSQRERMESFNEFMHGCRNPIHVFGVGYIDPNTREGKRFLDP